MNADALDSQHALALRPGVLLADRFCLARSVRGTSPFAFTYLAEDLTTGENVVIKEFFPRSLVSRGSDGIVVRAHSPECERDFLRALHRFALEGAVLAESSHPNLVRVRAVVDANATVYLVMEQRETQPLADYVRAKGGRIASAEAGRFAQQLLSALQVLHTESIIHRDLSPRTVHIAADGSAMLLEFSARRHLPVHATDLAAGFAAFEQYGMRDIGPWTDVYAISALLYYMLTGSVPPSALDRAAGENVVAPMTSALGIAPGLARLVAKGMSLLPQQRPHAVSELRRQLDGALVESGNAASRNTSAAAPTDVTASEAAAMDDSGASDYDRSVPLRLAAGGIVVPGEERGIKLLRLLGSAASRLRRSMTPNVTAASHRLEVGHDEARPTRAAARPVEARRAPVAERAPSAVAAPTYAAVSVPKAPAAPIQLAEAPASDFDLAAEIAMATDAMQSTFEQQEQNRRRYSIAAGAALVLVVGSALVLLARNSRASGIRTQESAATGGTRAASTSAPAAADAHVTVDGGAVLQSIARNASTTARTEADAPSATKRATPSRAAQPAAEPASAPASQGPPVLPATRMPNVKFAFGNAAPDLKIIPPELLVDPRTRLTNGEDQVEQGEYVIARRNFRSAIVQLDSAAVRYPESQAIKSLKRDLEQADAHAAQACTAENEMRKRRGEQVRVCQ